MGTNVHIRVQVYAWTTTPLCKLIHGGEARNSQNTSRSVRNAIKLGLHYLSARWETGRKQTFLLNVAKSVANFEKWFSIQDHFDEVFIII